MTDSASETESEGETPVIASVKSSIPADDGSPHSGVFQRPISPPSLKRKVEQSFEDADRRPRKVAKNVYVPSPIHLTRIKKAPNEYNLDCVTLHDLIGDPIIVECWQFNFLFNVDFLMYARADRDHLKQELM